MIDESELDQLVEGRPGVSVGVAGDDRPARVGGEVGPVPRPGVHRAIVAAARAVAAAGGVCRVTEAGRARDLVAADGLSDAAMVALVRAAGGAARLVLTGPRAQALGLPVPLAVATALTLAADVDEATLRGLAWVPTVRTSTSLQPGVRMGEATEIERAGLDLAKRGGLLPVILSLPEGVAGTPDIAVAAADVFAQRACEIASLTPSVEARLPIAAAEDARIVAFRSAAGGSEQVALLIGRPEQAVAPLCRLHSECLTGDLFGSLRCDCGEQLDGAIARMAAEGGGILLYLREEGRGIGLVNKLRAYRLQDSGLDTVDANMHLGFMADERDFAIAATMLQRLGFDRVRLMTNNPEKMEALARHGITVEARVPLSFAANRHNRFYLETKAKRSGHLLRVIEGGRPVAASEMRDPILRLLLNGGTREVGT